jgi:hypothetical protein
VIDRLTRALIDVGRIPEPIELADLLWLATQVGGDRQDASDAAPATAISPAAREPELARTKAEVANKAAAPANQTPENEVSAPVGFASGVVRGNYMDGILHVRGVAVTGMAASVTRPLQAFSRRLASRSEDVLDEEATAEQAAKTGIWMPVMEPVREYGFDLLLVTEESETSPLWTDAVGEFERMLATQVAFRNVHRLRLRCEGGGELVDEHGNTGFLQHWRGSRTAQVLFVSDTLSPRWRDSDIHALLRTWCDTGPLTLLQPMPRRAWRHLPLGLPELKLSSDGLVQHNRQLSVDDDEWFGAPPAGAIALPMIGFDEASLQRWARVMTGHSDIDVPGVYVAPGVRGDASGEVDRTASAVSLGGPERVALFRQMASPAAYELAVHLSVMETMTIPIMRLVQRLMHPDSGAGEMAEVFLGGLLEPIGQPDAVRIATDRLYRFMPEVREVLFTSRRRSDERKIECRLEVIDEQMPSQNSALPTRSGYFLTPSTGDRLTDWVLPFSATSRRVLSDHTMGRRLASTPNKTNDFNRDEAILSQRQVVRETALRSEYALADDEVLGDIPLVAKPEGSVWLVGMVRQVLVMSYMGDGPGIVMAIAVEKLVLVDADKDGQGRGWLNLHQSNRKLEFDTELWRNQFKLQHNVRTLGMRGQAEKNKRLVGALAEGPLSVQEFSSNAVFFKIASDSGEVYSSSKGWDEPSFLDLEAGWLAPAEHRMLHAYDSSIEADELLRTISRRFGRADRNLFAVPFQVPRSLMLIRMAPVQVKAVTAIARELHFEMPRALQVIFNRLRTIFRSADGISWENPDLSDLLTHSFFNDTFEPGDVQYGEPVSLTESGQELLSDEVSDPEDADPAALAAWLTEVVDSEEVPGLNDAIFKELSRAVDGGDWDIEADSHMYIESDDAHGVLEKWEFGGEDGEAFEVVDFQRGDLTVARQIIASVRVYGSFSFSVKDGIDKDMVYMGSTEAERLIQVHVHAQFAFAGVVEQQPTLEWIEIERISTHVNFGNVEPDYSDHEDDNYHDDDSDDYSAYHDMYGYDNDDDHSYDHDEDGYDDGDT